MMGHSERCKSFLFRPVLCFSKQLQQFEHVTNGEIKYSVRILTILNETYQIQNTNAVEQNPSGPYNARSASQRIHHLQHSGSVPSSNGPVTGP